MKRIILPLSLALFSACGNDKDNRENRDTVVDKIVNVAPVSEIQAYRPNIDNTPWEGNLYDAIYWRDTRGENAVIISGKAQYFWERENPGAENYFPKGEDKETLSELTELFAMHYVLKPGEAQWSKYYSYHDFLFGCCDVWMQYQPGSLQVADADSNGIGEALFMYHETEGDGVIDHNYLGTLILEKDSAVYEIQDETGLGTELKREKQMVNSDQIVLNTPKDTAYANFMLRKWDELYKKKVEQDRASLTEDKNVDDGGHADHVH